MANEFVLARLVRISGADLNLFEFDYDLTWVAFFMNGEEKIYGRYGGRDASHPDHRLSLPGMRYAMQAALTAHRQDPKAKPAARPDKPLRVEDYPAARRNRDECIHCHQVYEFRRAAQKEAGQWSRENVWGYPLPENVGLALDVDVGNRLKSVKAGSPAAKAGLQAGDLLMKLNDLPVASFADAQYALHKAPVKGQVPVVWTRDGKEQSARLELTEGWRKTNLTWRPSMLDILPSLTLYGDDLTPVQKKALGLSEKRLAFEQDKVVHSEAKKAGVLAGDVIIGINGEVMEMSMVDFLGHVRRNFLIGDQITLNVLRGGKRLTLPWTLR